MIITQKYILLAEVLIGNHEHINNVMNAKILQDSKNTSTPHFSQSTEKSQVMNSHSTDIFKVF